MNFKLVFGKLKFFDKGEKTIKWLLIFRGVPEIIDLPAESVTELYELEGTNTLRPLFRG